MRVLVVEDGPTLTHGGMPFGAGLIAARQHVPWRSSIPVPLQQERSKRPTGSIRISARCFLPWDTAGRKCVISKRRSTVPIAMSSSSPLPSS